MIQEANPIVVDAVPRAPKRYHRAILASVVFHGCLIAVLVFWYLPDAKSGASLTPGKTSKAVLATEILRGQPSAPPAVGPEADVPVEQIQASVKSQVEAAAKASDEQKLAELDRNLERLERVAAPVSVDEVAGAIANSMGLDRNQFSGPKTSEEGVFDPNTAQVRDVMRTQDAAGQWTYQALMVDINGREATVPLSQTEGQPAFEMFEKIKQYPMAESIYRQLVMPMLQKMLESDRL